MLKISLVTVILAVVSANPGEKLFSCCKKVSTAEIEEPIIKYEIQRPNPPCVRAVIFTTQTGHYCSHPFTPWVFQKIQELRRAEAQSSTPQVVTSTPPSPSSFSLLSILTSIAAPPSSSPPGPTSSSPPSSSPPSSSPPSSSPSAFSPSAFPSPSSSSPSPSASSFFFSASTNAESETFSASRDQ